MFLRSGCEPLVIRHFFRARSLKRTTFESQATARTRFPLPRGEGQGEGQTGFRAPGCRPSPVITRNSRRHSTHLTD
jgi:hypothetical protein